MILYIKTNRLYVKYTVSQIGAAFIGISETVRDLKIINGNCFSSFSILRDFE